MKPTYTLLFKRLLSCIYDLLILIAIGMLVTFIFVYLLGDASQGIKRLLLQLCLFITAGIYFVYSWVSKGQTIAMRAWRLKLVKDESLLGYQQAIIRYLLSSVLMMTGISIVWALVDNEHVFLHDRLLKTRVNLI